ncbi:unnamed protein product, partial [Schistosoma mattheei]
MDQLMFTVLGLNPGANTNPGMQIHPANGFLKSKGCSGYIPLAYREALIQLLQLFHTTKFNSSNINVYEYTRPEWTFHAKGLWIESVHNDDDKKKKKNEKNTDDD